MITTYFDKGCKVLKSSQDLKLENDCSAIWFCIEKGNDLSRFLEFMILTFSSFVGFFWLAFSGRVGSPKILELKRSFGHWSISKDDVASKHDSLDENGNKLYSDIAQIGTENIDAFASIMNRNLFGIDSALFFLPTEISLPSFNIAKPLTNLLVKRNAASVVDAERLNEGLIEEFIADIVGMDGIATVTLRDSNMCTMVVAVGNHFTLSKIASSMEGQSPEVDWKHIVDDAEFSQLMDIGVSVSAFS